MTQSTELSITKGRIFSGKLDLRSENDSLSIFVNSDSNNNPSKIEILVSDLIEERSFKQRLKRVYEGLKKPLEVFGLPAVYVGLPIAGIYLGGSMGIRIANNFNGDNEQAVVSMIVGGILGGIAGGMMSGLISDRIDKN